MRQHVSPVRVPHFRSFPLGTRFQSLLVSGIVIGLVLASFESRLWLLCSALSGSILLFTALAHYLAPRRGPGSKRL